MRIIAVDDEPFALLDLEEAIRTAAPEMELITFNFASDALAYAEKNNVDVAFLDVEMTGENGLALARKLLNLNPKTNIVFATGHADYSCDAFSLHASGYVLKPVMASAVRAELDNLRHAPAKQGHGRIYVQCFGNFEVFVDGSPLIFPRRKTKELLAYLVSRRGACIENGELAAVLWEDKPDSPALQSNLRNLVSDLSTMFKSLGIEDVFKRARGCLCVSADKLDCDYFNFLKGDLAAINSYTGEFMSQYSWAEFNIGVLEHLNGKNR